jgi:hypothetical protein
MSATVPPVRNECCRAAVVHPVPERPERDTKGSCPPRMTRPAETGDTTTDLGVNGPTTTPHAPGPAPAPAGTTQPITPPEPTRKLNISTTQVGAAAAASVTSALGASFLGAGGTIAGAAVGSIISTVAGAIYTRSLETAGTKLRETTVRVTQVPNDGARRPGSVPTHLADVDDPPVSAADADLETTVVAPVEQVNGSAPPRVPPAATPVDAVGAAGSGAPGGPGGPRVGRKPLLVTAGVALAGFGIAVAGISAAEGVLGRPVSGGSGGTSIGRVVTTDTAAEQDEQAPEQAPEVTPTGESEPTPNSEVTEEPGDEASPTGEPADGSSAEPTAEPTGEPAGEPTDAPEEQVTP